METLTKNQLTNIEKYIMENGRELEKAKWNYLFNNGEKGAILDELLTYQNSDGGFGKGLEADIQMPDSSSIASTEAIFTAYEYELDCEEKWFKDLLSYFEKTMDDGSEILSFWEKVTEQVDHYPHAPWWNYSKETRFTPNPCAVVASAFLKYGNDHQKALGYKITKRCIEFLKSNEPCYDHDCYCLQVLIEVLEELQSEFIDDEVMKHMERRILGSLCTDSKRWMEYVAQPLDFITSPHSRWYKLLEPYIEENINYWLTFLKEEGYWLTNFSWGIDNEISRQVTIYWQCYMALNRVKILRAFENVIID
ncbi:hypothetical protein CQJ30_03835 [Caldibacillus thermoamylovorans]|uniref:hypothetical protein n=1 Tax=Caldibacillus thermoamylovorans TaxID=35841 RepID=UPI000D55B112|nr:hypothetical protein [Caldibacillus thermoamylovorans]AWI11386.1 hypothetical protein CQJ30_03835 [Caldibacillus thermoamylovorans]